MRKISLRELGLTVLLAATIPGAHATAQSGVDALGDPADIFGYSVDKTEEPDSDDVVARALQALEQTASTAEEIQMTFGVENFHFVPLDAAAMDKIAPEIARREVEMAQFRTALEASAIFYSALERESIDITRVVAVDMSEAENGLPSDNRVTVYFIQ